MATPIRTPRSKHFRQQLHTGGARLGRFLVQTGMTQAQLARKLPGRDGKAAHRSIVGHLISGRRQATLAQACIIERLTKGWAEGAIRPSEWCSLEELALMPEAEAA